MMTRRHASLAIAVAGSLSAALVVFGCSDDAAPPSDEPTRPAEDMPGPDPTIAAEPDAPLASPFLGIASTYHGLLVGEDGGVLRPDVQGVLDLQAEFIALLAAPHDQFAVAAALDSQQLTDEEQIAVQDVLISWLLEDADRRRTYGRTHSMLRPYALTLAGADRAFWEARPWLESFLFDDLDLGDHRFAAHRRGQDYIDQCAANSVPVPPNWKSPQWTFKGELPNSLAFLDGIQAVTHVYTFQNPGVPGLCVSLPRLEEGGIIGFMGIICQSKTTGKACFWDNLSFQTGLRIKGPIDTPMNIVDLQNANDLAENCTVCHRGENVFVVHPENVLNLGPASASNVWYKPLSSQGWSNPPPFLNRGSSTCSGCHAIASLGPTFCSTILSAAANRTMPNATHPVGWNSNQPDVVLMRNACQGNPPVCGNGVCSLGENECTCAADCPSNPNACSICECGSVGGNCFCDDACTAFGDCCGNKAAVCGTPVPNPNSCQASNACGGQTPSGCFCDAVCVDFGDCCFDGPC